jgi:predicted nucleic acid-binding protein
MRWALNDNTKPEVMAYAASVLQLLANGDTAHVPNLWALEASNVLSRTRKKSQISDADMQQFLALLKQLDIQVDALTHDHALGDTLRLAMTYDLSSYDAAYLELAMRLGLPLATVDDLLGEALPKAGVKAVNFRRIGAIPFSA